MKSQKWDVADRFAPRRLATRNTGWLAVILSRQRRQGCRGR